MTDRKATQRFVIFDSLIQSFGMMLTADEIEQATKKIVGRMESGPEAWAFSNHCGDCCCAKAWEALEISDYTGLSIPEEIKRLMTALRKVKENVENEGWCPICDEHTCREGYCILAGL